MDYHFLLGIAIGVVLFKYIIPIISDWIGRKWKRNKCKHLRKTLIWIDCPDRYIHEICDDCKEEFYSDL